MITYNDIYEASRKERYSEQLQKLPKNFISDVAEYLRDKKSISSKEEGIFSDVVTKTKKQLENARTLFKELVLRRRKKILNLVLIAGETGISRQDFENMIDFEKRFFEELMKCVENFDKELDYALNGENEEKQKNTLVIFKENVEEFVGMNGEKMGPFEKGQIANLPYDIASILIEDKKAEKTEE